MLPATSRRTPTAVPARRDRTPNSLAKLPGIAALAVEPPVRFVVPRAPPRIGIPMQFAMVPIRQIAEVHGRDGPRTDLDVGDGPFAAAYTIEPVSVMARRRYQVHIALAQRLFDDLGGLTREHAAVDV